jgi:hypothetical protein
MGTHLPLQYRANRQWWAQKDSAHCSNVPVALLQYVGPWPIILN